MELVAHHECFDCDPRHTVREMVPDLLGRQFYVAEVLVAEARIRCQMQQGMVLEIYVVRLSTVAETAPSSHEIPGMARAMERDCLHQDVESGDDTLLRHHKVNKVCTALAGSASGVCSDLVDDPYVACMDRIHHFGLADVVIQADSDLVLETLHESKNV